MNKWILALLFGLTACTPYHNAHRTGGPGPQKPTPAGGEVSPQTYLRKLSLHIRGLTPTRAEYGDLAAAIKEKKDKDFLRRKVREYLASPQHVDKMTFRLEELFLLAPSGVNYFSPLSKMDRSPVNDYSLNNSMNDMFRDIVTRNLTWDTLLTGRTYKAHPLKAASLSTTSDLLYLSSISGTSPAAAQPVEVSFKDDDVRVAGSLTTSRFFNRYGNTALNKNRRRAAAVFRIFLCDDMKAVVVDEKGNQDAILDRVFPGGGGHPRQPGTGLDKHGADPACMKCHYKLDPMGLTFQASGMILSPFASPGALVFKREDGSEVNRSGRGIGEVAQAITEQPEYVRCQVQHFWRWFVGQDQPLDRSRLDELSAKFEEVKRRPNDFIAYLVSRPEFGSAREGDGQLIYQVKSVLQNCNGCHANEGIPSFTEWPIGGSEELHAKYLVRIRSALSLDGSGKPRWMPPKKSAWQPAAEQLATLQKWFDLGAPADREVL